MLHYIEQIPPSLKIVALTRNHFALRLPGLSVMCSLLTANPP